MHRTNDPSQVEFFKPPRRESAIIVVAGLIALYWLRYALLPFALSASIAFVLTPLVERLARRMPRAIAAVIIFVILLLSLGVLSDWLAVVVSPGAANLKHDAPQLAKAIFEKCFGADHAHLFGMDIDAQSLTRSARDAISGQVGDPAHAIAILAAAAMGAFVTLLLTLFFLLSGPKLLAGFFTLFPAGMRPTALAFADALKPMLMRYIVGVITLSLTMGILSYIVFGVCVGLPNATLVAISTAVLEMIPVIGPILAAALVGLIAFSTGNTAMVIGVVIGALLLRLLVDQLLAPIVFGKAVSLHPVVVILALIVGGTVYGVLGVFLAVPVAASIRIAIQLRDGEMN